MFFSSYKKQYIKLLRLAAPVMLAHLGVIFVQFADNAMVGRLGAVPLAAVAFGGTVFFIVFIFIMGITISLTPLVGEQFAQGKRPLVAAYFQNSLLLFPLIGIIASALQYALIPLLYYLKQPVEVVDMAIPYYKYLVWSVTPFMIFAAFKQFLEGVGNTTACMVIVIVSNLINIFFNWLLIYGNWGFPKMEATGAGLDRKSVV